ncbi:hypothetical protein CNMCM6106_005443 [Aspergillus hiratsukae]|uniref:Dickkopf N-terminal cysteine-rich domain-containing protein n=1 Tax=Aspergillus hiratsukae TaxID=1194566 RepID=A0A8H6QC01_9EURO|nr:hypothetical protein CNMCM6106_005443 [Aspergillus hiratsukae]
MKFSTLVLGMSAGMAASAAIPASVDDKNTSDNGLGLVNLADPACHKDSDCGPGVGYCYNGICVAYPPKVVERADPACHKDSDCGPGVGYCYKGICVAYPPKVTRDDASIVHCATNEDCFNGLCIAGICHWGIGEDPASNTANENTSTLFQTSEPADPDCHKDSDCGPGVGYCYHGICVANPPLLARGEQADPACHKDSDCGPGVGYCYHGICVAYPPK